MLKGLNHLTLSVADLERSIAFYRDRLGMRLSVSWTNGAYLEAGELWLCLSRIREGEVAPAGDYTHYAFSVDAERFDGWMTELREHGVTEWQQNRSEGDSFYFLDPDGHRLELHVGDLASRLAHCRQHPYADMRFHD
jgi:catechol 2,3-dioxygenase-like lactoylglutathione lyase family enzyme